MGTVVEVNKDELLAQRAALVARAGMPWEQVVELADAYALSAEERNLYESVRAIDYLLGEDEE